MGRLGRCGGGGQGDPGHAGAAAAKGGGMPGRGAHPEIQAGVVDTEPVQAKFAGLHTKALVVDREYVYIGSLNLDPRSIRLNTEMGMIVTSPALAEEVAAIAERDMAPANSWRVRLDENGKLLWESDAGVVTRQPAQSAWQRVQAWFFKIAPEGQL